MESMTKKEILDWFDAHKEELKPDLPRQWEPVLKPLSETVELAKYMSELGLSGYGDGTVLALMAAKMKVIGLPVQAILAYVNYAGHNTLPIRVLAKKLNTHTKTVAIWFMRMRNEWPQLFDSALCHERNIGVESKCARSQDKSVIAKRFRGDGGLARACGIREK